MTATPTNELRFVERKIEVKEDGPSISYVTRRILQQKWTVFGWEPGPFRKGLFYWPNNPPQYYAEHGKWRSRDEWRDVPVEVE